MSAHEALAQIQFRLQSYYGLEQGPDVREYVRFEGERETLLVREGQDALEVSLVLPKLSHDGLTLHDLHSDSGLQFIEGVSHFLYIVERARTELPVTQLELELQAEVDKFVFLALGDPEPERAPKRLRQHLYEEVRYLHPAGSELGDRYRTANSLAARFVARLNTDLGSEPVKRQLRRFYRSGQTEKLSLARAA